MAKEDKSIKTDVEFLECLKQIKIKIRDAKHYLYEYDKLKIFSDIRHKYGHSVFNEKPPFINRRNPDREFTYNHEKYNGLLPYMCKAYIAMVFVELNIIFDNSSKICINNIRSYAGKIGINLPKKEKDISKIYEDKINKIRNKAIAHMELENIDLIFQEYNTSVKDLMDFISKLEKWFGEIIRVIDNEKNGFNEPRKDDHPADGLYKEVSEEYKVFRDLCNLEIDGNYRLGVDLILDEDLLEKRNSELLHKLYNERNQTN